MNNADELKQRAIEMAAEADAIAWFERQGESIPDSRIRFDEVALVIFDGGKAMIRHHINALGEA